MSSQLPTISIVTPSFQQAAFLDETIRSVCGQTLPPTEYVVIDGGSTDGSAEIVARHAAKLTAWCSEADGGQYDAINKGFARTTGEVMAWLNSDDKYLPWTLSIVAEIFAEFPEVEWLTTLFPMRWDGSGRAVRCVQRRGYSRAGFLAAENLPTGAWFYDGWIQQETTFWRRSLWERAGGKLESQWKLAADFELWARFHQHAELYAIDAPLGGFRLHGAQRSRQQQDAYGREASEILRAAGGAPRSRSASLLRSIASRSTPGALRPLAHRAGWLHQAKLCLRRRDNAGWRLATALY